MNLHPSLLLVAAAIPLVLTGCGSKSDDAAVSSIKDINGLSVVFAGNAGDVQDRPFYINGSVTLTGFDREPNADGSNQTTTLPSNPALTVSIPTTQYNTGGANFTSQAAYDAAKTNKAIASAWLKNQQLTLTGSTSTKRLGVPYYVLTATYTDLLGDTVTEATATAAATKTYVAKTTSVRVGFAKDINGSLYAFSEDSPTALVVTPVTSATINIPVTVITATTPANVAGVVQPTTTTTVVVTDFTLGLPISGATPSGIAPYSGVIYTATNTFSIAFTNTSLTNAAPNQPYLNVTTAAGDTAKANALNGTIKNVVVTGPTNWDYLKDRTIAQQRQGFTLTTTNTGLSAVTGYWKPGLGLIEAVTVAPAYTQQPSSATSATITGTAAAFTVNDKETGTNTAGFSQSGRRPASAAN